MTDLTEELQDLLEAVDADLVSREELNQIVARIDDPQVQTAMLKGIELLRLLDLMDPQSVLQRDPMRNPPS